MPSELRRLIFNNEEMLAAVTEYRAAGLGPLPAGEILSCRAYGEPRLRFRLEMRSPEREDPVILEIAPEIIGAALLRFCIARGIPVPKRAEKALQVHGDNIALSLSIKARTAPLAAEGDGPVAKA